MEKLASFAAHAAGEGAELAVFPEAFIGGYPKGADFGARVGSRSSEGRDWFRRYFEAAVDARRAPELDTICATAKTHDLALVVGVIEREGGTLYCTAVFIGRDGTYLGKHRKLMPTAMERLIWGMGDGSTMPVLDMILHLGRAQRWAPRSAGKTTCRFIACDLYGQGIQIWCAPTVDERERWQNAMRHIAYEGRCFVLSACQYSVRGDYPRDYPCAQGDDPATVMIAGGSAIVSPQGEILAGPLRDEEGVLTADLELGEIARGKFDLDVAGHYARPDVFSLAVDTRAKPAVQAKEE